MHSFAAYGGALLEEISVNQETAEPEEKTTEADANEEKWKRLIRITGSGGAEVWVMRSNSKDNDSSKSNNQCVAPSKMTNTDMLKDFAGDVLSYVVAIFIAVKLGITSSPSEPMRPFTVVALLCVFLGFALAKKYFYNRSK